MIVTRYHLVDILAFNKLILTTYNLLNIIDFERGV